ncbi:MAG: hypothetical protein ABJN26_27335 [Stappiaceae bacterium]
MSALQLANDRIALEILPEFGARVTKLIDRRSGRNWLVEGSPVGSPAEDAVFGGAEARGWDECFPTVAPCSDEIYKRMLRDHGDLWGRPWRCRADKDAIYSSFDGDVFRFNREVRLVGNDIELAYKVVNIGSEPMPYLWSQHCLLATGPDDRIALEGIGRMTVTGGSLADKPLKASSFHWPFLSVDVPDLGIISDKTAAFCLKSYAPVTNRATATVTGKEGAISFSWDAEEMSFLGLWLDYGAWPESDPVHQIAIEPTTAAADDLAGAHRNGQVRWLNAQKSDSWSIRLTLSPNAVLEGDHNVE